MIGLRKTAPATHIADVWAEERFIYVEAVNSESMLVQSLMKGIPSQVYDPVMLTWQFMASPSVAIRIREVLGSRARYHYTFDNVLEHGKSTDSAQALKNVNPESFPEIPGMMGESWPHQKQAYAYISRVLGIGSRSGGTSGAGLFADMGTGKTRVGLGLIAANPRLIRRVLIICPKRVIKTWPEEASKHMPSESMLPMYLLAGITNKTAREWEQEFEYTIRPDIRSYVRIYNGTTKERGEAIIDHKLTPGIFVCNYDALVYPHFADALYECEWDLIILDEAHKIKAAGGKTSKFMARLGKKARYKLGQTGTPNADKPIDLYGLYRFLDPGIFGTSFNRFKDRYAVFGGYQGREIIGYQNLDELSDKMYTIAFRVTDEVTKLPPTMEHIVRVNLGPKAREAYEELKEEMVYSLAEGTITVQNALTKILRLQQITSGYVPMQYVEGSEDQLDAQLFTKLQYFEKDKQEALLEIMEDMPEKEPLVVFCKFVQDLEYIKEAAGMMGRPYLEISGRRDDLGKFKNPDSGNCVLGVQITAGGAGVDLTRAHYVVYYSLTHSLTSYEQSLKRVHRPGQKNTVHYYYLTASNTIDVLIRKALREKKSVAKYVLDNVQQDQYYTDPAWGVSQMVGV